MSDLYANIKLTALQELKNKLNVEQSGLKSYLEEITQKEFKVNKRIQFEEPVHLQKTVCQTPQLVETYVLESRLQAVALGERRIMC